MHCTKCGAVVYGRFCSCCGQRVRTSFETFRLVERGTERAFKKEHVANGSERLAEACWLASCAKHSKIIRSLWAGDEVPDSAYEELKRIREHAEILFNRVIDF